MGFSRQEFWSGLPCPPAEDLPNSGNEPRSPVSPAWQVDSLPLNHRGSYYYVNLHYFLNVYHGILEPGDHAIIFPEET